MPIWPDYTVAAKTALEAAEVPATRALARLLGYASVGDGGGASYIRVDSEPSHAGKIRSTDRFLSDGTEDAADGGWWEIVPGEYYDSRAFGIFPDTGSEVLVATMQGFLDHQADNNVFAVFPPGKYLGNQGVVDFTDYVSIELKSHARIRAHGVDFEDYTWAAVGKEHISFQGGRYYNKQVGSSALFDFNVKNLIIEDCHFDQEAPATTSSPWVYIREGATAADQPENVYFHRCKFTNRTNVWLWNVRNCYIDHCLMENNTGDDSFVIKTRTGRGICENVFISNSHFNNVSGILCIGAQVGETVRNVHVTNCTAIDSGMIYVRADDLVNALAELNGGLVQNITISDCTLHDISGTDFAQFAVVLINAGSRLDGLTATNCKAYVRCRETPSETTAFSKIRMEDAGASGSRIENVLFDNCWLIDLHHGVDLGAADDDGVTSVGHPVERWDDNKFPAAAISNGEIRNIEFRDCHLDGTRDTGIRLDGEQPIKYVRPYLRNIARNPAATADGVFKLGPDAAGLTAIEGARVVKRPAISRLFRKSGSGDHIAGAKDAGLSGHYSVAAGTTSTLPVWIAPQDLLVTSIEMVNAAAITADATDFLSLKWDSNRGGLTPVSGNRFSTEATSVVAGEAINVWNPDTPGGTAMPDGVYLDKGHSLRLTKSDSGTGQPLDNAVFIVSYISLGSDGDAD